MFNGKPSTPRLSRIRILFRTWFVLVSNPSCARNELPDEHHPYWRGHDLGPTLAGDGQAHFFRACDPVFWALSTAAGHFATGLALIVNRLAILATRLAGLMYLCFAAIVWTPEAVAHPDQWLRWAGDAITLVLMAAVWLVGDYLSTRSVE